MKTLVQMLRELSRADVSEFAVVSDRLPCVKIAGNYEPIDDAPRSTEAILEMLLGVGGSRHVEDLEAKPAQWSTRVDGVGSIAITAAFRAGRVQARFTLERQSPVAQAKGRPSPTGAVEHPTARHPPAGSRSNPPPPRNVAAPLAAVRPPSTPPPAVRQGRAPSEPTMRAAVVPLRVGPQPDIAALDELLATARQASASDMHIVAGRPMLLRIAGELLARGAPIEEAVVQATILPAVPERVRPMLDEHGSCDFAIERPSGRYRVNVARQRSGLKACFRCIAANMPTLVSLGLPPEIERATHHHQGLVLVTG
ncbi:MAG: twitching motility protein, partial [Myxococcota bacterium]|nr:twitching motility protein [Myxococcota bacterium]